MMVTYMIPFQTGMLVVMSNNQPLAIIQDFQLPVLHRTKATETLPATRIGINDSCAVRRTLSRDNGTPATEFEIWSTVSGQAHILPLIGWWLEGESTYCAATPLFRYDLKHGLKDMDDAAKGLLAWEAAVGLANFHAAGFTHRNIKSTSYFVDQDYHVMLGNFQMATNNPDEPHHSDILGSLVHTAPEAYSDNQERRHAGKQPADVYAFGMLLYEIFGHVTPWEFFAESDVVYLMKKGDRPRRPFCIVDDDMWALIGKCWQHNPEERPTMQQVANELWDVVTKLESYIHVKDSDASSTSDTSDY